MTSSPSDSDPRPRSRPRRIVHGLIAAAAISVVTLLLIPQLFKAREADRRQTCKAHLKEIELALHNYHDQYHSLPPAYVLGPDRKRWHSWRVLLLPALGHADLYREYHMDEPWDGPHNITLREKIPAVYGCPSNGNGHGGLTNYLAVVGRATAWPEQYASNFRNAKDGLSNCIFVSETNELEVPWLEPRDFTRDELVKYAAVTEPDTTSQPHPGGRNMLMGDGAVRFLSRNITSHTLRALVSINGGSPLPGVDWPPLPVPEAADLPAPRSASEFQETDIVATPSAPLVSGRNTMYCCTFQIAWQKCEKVFGGPLILAGDPPVVQELNTSSFRTDDLAPACYIATGGAVAKAIEDIQAEFQRKFPGKQPHLTERAQGHRILIYAYLSKRLPFQAVFDALPTALSFKGGSSAVDVKSFGLTNFIDHGERDFQLKEQVTILDYLSDQDFILELKAGEGGDRIVLAKVVPHRTLGETIAAVQKRIAMPDAGHQWPKLDVGDSLVIPELTMNVERIYTELVGRGIGNPGWNGWLISGATQTIRFKLDETGAVLESEAEVLGDNGHSAVSKQSPRNLVFDKPFLIYLREPKAQQPYFAGWIENGEVMTQVKKQ